MSEQTSAVLDIYKRLPFKIVRGSGAWVHDENGRAYLDMYGAHAVAVTGHSHPRLVQALQAQVAKLLFYSNAVAIEHQAEAAQALISALPKPLAKVFFVNSGAEAVENALKIARLVTGRRKIVSFNGGFHGRSLGALAATGLEKYRAASGLGRDVLSEVHAFATFGAADTVAPLLYGNDVAAVIVEPVQSLAGVVSASGEFFRELRHLCDLHGTLLIYDELQTGAGRSGTGFAYAPRHGVVPDLMTLGKGLGSGMPVAACVMTADVGAQVPAGSLGTTFGGGPLACLAVLTTLAILRDEGLAERVRILEARLRQGLMGAKSVVEIRGTGLLLGLKMHTHALPWLKALVDRGILVGLADDPTVIRLMPPLTLSDAELDLFLATWAKVEAEL